MSTTAQQNKTSRRVIKKICEFIAAAHKLCVPTGYYDDDRRESLQNYLLSCEKNIDALEIILLRIEQFLKKCKDSPMNDSNSGDSSALQSTSKSVSHSGGASSSYDGSSTYRRKDNSPITEQMSKLIGLLSSDVIINCRSVACLKIYKIKAEHGIKILNLAKEIIIERLTK